MEVKLLSHTPEPERVVATAARLCYASQAAEEVWAGFTRRSSRNLSVNS